MASLVLVEEGGGERCKSEGKAPGKESDILKCGAGDFCSQWGREGASFIAQLVQLSRYSRGVQPALVPFNLSKLCETHCQF